MEGKIDINNKFEIKESIDGKHTGTFTGKFIDNNTISGKWENPQKTKSFSLLM